MRKKIDPYHLETSVNLICRLKNTFSYYDITKAVRDVLPEYEILHEDIKSIVSDFVSQNDYVVSNNGAYNTFTKRVLNTPVKQQSKLEKLLAEKKVSKLPQIQPAVSKNYQETIIPMQSEGRVNITNIVRKIFGNDKVIVEKLPNQIKVYLAKNKAKSTNSTIVTSSLLEIRLRTGFKTNSVLVKTYADSIEITPKV